MLLQAEDLQVQGMEQLHLLLLQEGDVPVHALDLVLQGHGLHRNQIRWPGLWGAEVAHDQQHAGCEPCLQSPCEGQSPQHGAALPFHRDVTGGEAALLSRPLGTAPRLPQPHPAYIQAEGSEAAQGDAAARTLPSEWLISVLTLALGNVPSRGRTALEQDCSPQSPAGSCTRGDVGSHLTSHTLHSSSCRDRSTHVKHRMLALTGALAGVVLSSCVAGAGVHHHMLMATGAAYLSRCTREGKVNLERTLNPEKHHSVWMRNPSSLPAASPGGGEATAKGEPGSAGLMVGPEDPKGLF